MIQWYSDMLLILARVLKAAEVLWLDKSRWPAFPVAASAVAFCDLGYQLS